MLITKESTAFLNNLGMGLRPRAKVTSIAIAKALADTVPLPSGKVDSIEFLFNSSFSLGILNKLSKINEITPVDCPVIQDYLLRFYKARYNIVHAPNTIFSFNRSMAIADFFGFSSVIDEDATKLITEAPTEVSRIYNGIRRLLDEFDNNEGGF